MKAWLRMCGIVPSGLQDYFNTTSLEELKEAIQNLSPSYQSIIYKKYGQKYKML